MHASFGSLVRLALVFVAAQLLCCTGARTIHLRLVDYNVSAPRGVEIYGLDAKGLPAKRVSRIEFRSLKVDPSGAEVLEYALIDAAGAFTGPMYTQLTRSSAFPAAAELHLAFTPGGPGYFVARAYNVAGFSQYSRTAMQIL